jgi:hypothetical protein
VSGLDLGVNAAQRVSASTFNAEDQELRSRRRVAFAELDERTVIATLAGDAQRVAAVAQHPEFRVGVHRAHRSG